MEIVMTRRVLAMVALGAFTLVTGGCADSPSAPSGALNEPVTLAVGESVRVSDARLTLIFEGVTNDSRCPADAICISDGDATVMVRVAPFVGQAARYELHTGGPSSVRHGDFTIAVDQLSPYPFSLRPVDPSSYKAVLRVTSAR